MHDITIRAEKAAEKQDVDRAARQRDPACTLPAKAGTIPKQKSSATTLHTIPRIAQQPGRGSGK